MKNEKFVEKWVFRNGSYKVVALFVALVLWVAILGRKDFVLTHELPLELSISGSMLMVTDVVDIVRVKIGGPRLALKRFRDSNPKLTIDLRQAGSGRTSFRIQESDFVLPPKVRLIAVSPSFLSVELGRKTP